MLIAWSIFWSDFGKNWKLIFKPWNFWSWISFYCTMKYTIITNDHISWIYLGSEFWRGLLNVGNIFRLLPFAFSFNNLSKVFRLGTFTKTDFINCFNSKFEFIANDEILDIGLTMTDFIKCNIPLAIWSRFFVSFLNLITNKFTIAIIFWYFPFKKSCSSNNFFNDKTTNFAFNRVFDSPSFY